LTNVGVGGFADGSAPMLDLSTDTAVPADDDEFGLDSELGACLEAKATGDGTCEALSLLLDLTDHLRRLDAEVRPPPSKHPH
jgi:hypothetical protein